jgi:uncharacterized peroxidase-related enzyme
MAHIALPEDRYGVAGPMAAYPATGAVLSEFAQVLMRGPSSLTPAEREVIAAYVSSGNECAFCTSSHAAAARHLLGEAAGTVDDVLTRGEHAKVDAKLSALLVIAGKVRVDGRLVTDDDVASARAHGADDQAIHDTVLIAAAFSLFNRYVDGLATPEPPDPGMYRMAGASLAERGYQATVGS